MDKLIDWKIDRFIDAQCNTGVADLISKDIWVCDGVKEEVGYGEAPVRTSERTGLGKKRYTIIFLP